MIAEECATSDSCERKPERCVPRSPVEAEGNRSRSNEVLDIRRRAERARLGTAVELVEVGIEAGRGTKCEGGSQGKLVGEEPGIKTAVDQCPLGTGPEVVDVVFAAVGEAELEIEPVCCAEGGRHPLLPEDCPRVEGDIVVRVDDDLGHPEHVETEARVDTNDVRTPANPRTPVVTRISAERSSELAVEIGSGQYACCGAGPTGERGENDGAIGKKLRAECNCGEEKADSGNCSKKRHHRYLSSMNQKYDAPDPTGEELAAFEEELAKQTRGLVRRDPAFKPLVKRYGLPSFRPHGRFFATLAKSIISQQISGRAADSIHRKVLEAIGGEMTPQGFDSVSDQQLRLCGLSPQKLSYLRSLVEHVNEGSLKLKQMRKLPDDEVIRELVAVRGIGEWTAQMFLMFSLGRLDVLPTGDLGVRKGVQLLLGKTEPITPRETLAVAEERRWAPARSIASWYMWAAIDPEDSAW